jgi:hypothetical protein
MKDRALIDLDESQAINYELENCKRNLRELGKQFNDRRAYLMAEAIDEVRSLTDSVLAESEGKPEISSLMEARDAIERALSKITENKDYDRLDQARILVETVLDRTEADA